MRLAGERTEKKKKMKNLQRMNRKEGEIGERKRTTLKIKKRKGGEKEEKIKKDKEGCGPLRA